MTRKSDMALTRPLQDHDIHIGSDGAMHTNVKEFILTDLVMDDTTFDWRNAV